MIQNSQSDHTLNCFNIFCHNRDINNTHTQKGRDTQTHTQYTHTHTYIYIIDNIQGTILSVTDKGEYN